MTTSSWPAFAQNPFVRQPGGDSSTTEAYELLRLLAKTAAQLSAASVKYAVARELPSRRPEVLTSLERQLVDELTARVSAAWEAGWEPRDLVHVAGRVSVRSEALASVLIVGHARGSGAVSRAPQRWRDQLDELGLDESRPRQRWRPISRPGPGAGDVVQTWVDLLLLLKVLTELTRLETIGPPPSQWGRERHSAAPSGSSASSRDRMLTKIRALLAKAEATNHPAEAETFTAKAQELMTRHAIDEAVLRSEQSDDVPVETRRVHLQTPYTRSKANLLHAVAQANRCRAIFMKEYDIAVLVGTPTAVDHVELLFTSLLIQATRAMAEAGHRRAGSFDRSPTFRKSFLAAYAQRIGERLTEADQATAATFGSALVPVLEREAEAVTAEFERLFPRTRSVRGGHVDPRGWDAGRAAADKATFVAGRLTA